MTADLFIPHLPLTCLPFLLSLTLTYLLDLSPSIFLSPAISEKYFIFCSINVHVQYSELGRMRSHCQSFVQKNCTYLSLSLPQSTPTPSSPSVLMLESPKREPSQTPPVTFTPSLNGFHLPSSIAESPIKDEMIDVS